MASAFSIRITDSFVDVDDDAEVGVGPVVGVDSSLEDTITKRFPIKYAGFIQEINGDIDPTGRTDLLKILDDAKINGHIDSTDTAKNFQQNAIISINYDAVTVHLLCNADYNADDTEESRLQLVVPLHMLASIGIVRDEEQNIIAMRIGAIDGATSAAVDIFDLAVLYTRTSEIADQIYDHLAVCFQFVYRESLSHSKTVHGQNESIEKFITVLSSCSSTTSHVTDHSGFEARKQPCLTASTNTSDSIKNTMDLINDYITMLSACLTHEELNRFAMFMRRWRAKEMPILEFAQKLLELYGIERKHLLARMKTLLRGVSREELTALSDFLQANGISDDAALGGSPGDTAHTAELSLGGSSSAAIQAADTSPSISGCSGGA